MDKDLRRRCTRVACPWVHFGNGEFGIDNDRRRLWLRLCDAARMAETSECLQNGLSHGGRLHVQQYGIAAPQARNGKSTHRVMHPSPISLKISLFHLSFQMNPAHHQFAECETLLHLHLADHLQLLSGESEGEGWFLGLVADSGRWYVFPFHWFTGFV